VLKLPRLFAVVCISFWLAPSARAWGCKGHEAVAILAEAHLTLHARAMAFKILAASPIDPALSRYCKEPNLDAFADASTWADDERTVKPETAPWHFIDIPLGATQNTISTYCPPKTGCVTLALASQLAILRNPQASPQARADALRYIIHFVGDIHQPLHDATNNDRGGNCVPVTFFGKAPQETNTAAESFSPNLHSVWDADIVERLANGRTPEQLAIKLNELLHARQPAWQSETSTFKTWAWEGHQLAEKIAYGKLPGKVPLEAPLPSLDSCADDDHVSTRLLQLHEELDAAYQDAAAPVVEEQLTKAGIRLANLLNTLWP